MESLPMEGYRRTLADGMFGVASGLISLAVTEKDSRLKSKSEIDVAALIGRIGPQAAIILRSRKAGPMADRRTRRNRTRSAQKRRAINENES